TCYPASILWHVGRASFAQRRATQPSCYSPSPPLPADHFWGEKRHPRCSLRALSRVYLRETSKLDPRALFYGVQNRSVAGLLVAPAGPRETISTTLPVRASKSSAVRSGGAIIATIRARQR